MRKRPLCGGVWVSDPVGQTVKTTKGMISGMKPELREGEFVFCSITDADKAVRALPDAIAFFREAEGISMILPLVAARGLGVATDQPMRCMTLMVYSALDGVGLTAAVATAVPRRILLVSLAHHVRI